MVAIFTGGDELMQWNLKKRQLAIAWWIPVVGGLLFTGGIHKSISTFRQSACNRTNDEDDVTMLVAYIRMTSQYRVRIGRP